MHELSICKSIADIALRHAAGRPVSVINVRIGQLRQIVPETLVYCWSLVSAGTPLAGAELAVERVPARIRCLACGHEAELAGPPAFRCGGCGGTGVRITAGEEFLITSLDLAGPAAAVAGTASAPGKQRALEGAG